MSKVGQSTTVFKKYMGCFSVFYFVVIRAFLNDLGQIRDVCSFEDIGESCFHVQIIANLSKTSKTVQRNLHFILIVLLESSIHFT